MPRPINSRKKISEVVTIPGALYKSADDIAAASNPRMGEIVSLLASMQQAFDRIKPLMPPNNGITAADWDAVAAENWGATPNGGVIPTIQAAAVAGNALTLAYATEFHPMICSRLYAVDPTTGHIAEPRSLVVSSPEMDTIRTQVENLRDALEPIAEL